MSCVGLMMFAARKLPKASVVNIIDDDDSVREATKAVIRSLGYHAETFASAEEYLETNHGQGSSCIITDVQMPGMSGVDLQDRLIANGEHAPIIFMSAFPGEKVRAKVMRSGAVGFLKKPVDLNCLIECLDKALKASRNQK